MASYEGNIISMVNSTFVGLALTLSKDVGMLETLIDADKPLTSAEIAEEGELKERYVREILGCLATAEVIHVSTNEAGSLVYHLDESEKQVFKTQTLSLLSFPIAMIAVYEQIKECCLLSGPYGVRFPKVYLDCMEEHSFDVVKAYVDNILKFAPGLRAKLESGIEVAEVGCVRGRVLAFVAGMFSKSNFTAFSSEPSHQERQRFNLGQLPSIKYEILDVRSPFSDPPSKLYDWVYCVNVIEHLPNPLEALKNIRNIMRPSGTFTMICSATSGSPVEDRGNLHVARQYALSSFFSVPESLQQDPKGQALGMCWGKIAAIKMAQEAGFQVQTVDQSDETALFICHL
ncbi:hypothetical protein BsWGS_10696 [Bradybaena similaris]